jgi:hypothetical protein
MRSVNHPVNGIVNIAVSVIRVNANETSPRSQWNSSHSVFNITPKALTSSDPKWKNSPTDETPTTIHAQRRAERRFSVSIGVPIVSAVCIYNTWDHLDSSEIISD